MSQVSGRLLLVQVIQQLRFAISVGLNVTVGTETNVCFIESISERTNNNGGDYSKDGSGSKDGGSKSKGSSKGSKDDSDGSKKGSKDDSDGSSKDDSDGSTKGSKDDSDGSSKDDSDGSKKGSKDDSDGSSKDDSDGSKKGSKDDSDGSSKDDSDGSKKGSKDDSDGSKTGSKDDSDGSSKDDSDGSKKGSKDDSDGSTKGSKDDSDGSSKDDSDGSKKGSKDDSDGSKKGSKDDSSGSKKGSEDSDGSKDSDEKRPPSLSSHCYTVDATDCDWYRRCLAERFPCAGDQAKYSIRYGGKFCEPYSRASSLRISVASTTWVNSVRQCIRAAFDPLLHRCNSEPSCDQIQTTAIQSYQSCFTSPPGGGSVCQVRPRVHISSTSTQLYLYVFQVFFQSIN